MITIAEIEAGICCSEFLDVRNHNHIAIKRDLDTGEGEYTIGFYHAFSSCAVIKSNNIIAVRYVYAILI